MQLQKLHKHAFFASMVLWSMTVASCSHEAQWVADADETLTRSVTFSIPLTAEESDLSDLQIFLYDAAGAEKLAQVEITSVEELEDGTQMIHGLLPTTCPAINGDSLGCHMVILGNCPENDGSPAALQTLTFEANSSSMPLVGAHQVKTRLDHRLEVLCPTTNMLRSGALVTVRLGDELLASGITFRGAKLLNGNARGFCAPLSMTQLNTSDDLATNLIFHPDTSQKADIPLQLMADGSLQSIVPECATPTEGPLELQLNFLRDGLDYTGVFGQKLYFKNYTDNVPFDIVRNHHYIFTIRSLQTEGDLEVKVEDWEQKTAEDVIFK